MTRDSVRSIAVPALLAVCASGLAQTPPGMMQRIPVLRVLDADQDEVVSAEEIANAPSALASLDADKDGALTSAELLPSFGGPGGGRGTRGGPGGSRGGGPGGFLSRLPVMTALDSDASGELSPEEIRNAGAALGSIDTDGDGSLAATELLPRFGGPGRRGGPGGRGRGGPSPVMAALDADSSGDLSAEEIDSAPTALAALDQDKSGGLSADELNPAGAGRRRGPGGPPEVPQVVQVLDADASGALSAAEIAEARESLEILDSNADGSLASSELESAQRGGFGGGPGGFGGRRGGGQASRLQQPEEVQPNDGVAVIPDRETFRELSYQGEEVLIDSGLRGLEFLKFLITGVESDQPKMYFMNTKTHRAHMMFMSAVGIGRRGPGGDMRGVVVYRPLLTSPSGSRGLYTFEFEPFDSFPFEKIQLAHKLLADKSPLMAGNLAYYPLPAALPRYKQEKAKYDAADLPVFSEDDRFDDIAYLPLNEAEGFGRLRLMEVDERPGARDVVLYRSLPNEMPRVAGVISEFRQTPLSHVNLRAVQDNVPNAYIRGATSDPKIAGLIGGYVYYKASADGYEIREASSEEVAAHFADLRPTESRTPVRDLSIDRIRPLAEVGFENAPSIGVKAANLAALHRVGLPDGVVPKGFAIPFWFYDGFMRANGLYEQAAVMTAEPGFSDDAAEREKALARFRKRIKSGEMPPAMAEALLQMQRAFGEGVSIRMRSSTNNEDLPGFSGAGLYDSYTHHPHEGHIEKTVKQVFASLWNFRAYEEREFYRIDHQAAAMGVLAHPNYSDELANGVAVSDDIVYQTAGMGRGRMFYVNTQVGEDLVTNPDAESIPEELLLGALNAAGDRLVRTSNRVSDGQPLLDIEQRKLLRRSLNKIHNRFRMLYGVDGDEPFAMEIEFKITAENELAVKQARPWVY